MTKVRIVYSDTMRDTAMPHDSTGTNGFVQPINETWDGSGESLTFTLRDSLIAKQFVEVWNLNKCGYDGTDTEFKIDYNEFSNIDLETRIRMQQRMNDVIDNINSLTNQYPIDEALKLEIGDDIQVDKLNALHRYFEDTSYALINSKEIRKSDLHAPLEIINQLVHRMEGITSEHKLFMTVIRNLQKIDIKKIYQLQNEDYDQFEPMERTGVLFLDFATVGKDLGACFHTNDIPLVQAKEVKQQLYCMPYFNYRFTTFGEGNTDTDWKKYYDFEMDKYYKWCSENNVENYYEYTQSKYRLGRIAIGDIDNDFKTTDYVNLIQEKPYIVGVYIEK